MSFLSPQVGKIPENVLSKLTAKILLGLVFLHKKHMVHRDIKVWGGGEEGQHMVHRDIKVGGQEGRREGAAGGGGAGGKEG